MSISNVRVMDSTTLCSTEYFCPNGKKEQRQAWIKKHELFDAQTTMGPRVVTPVCILGDEVPLMMDVITGSLYNIKTGRCLTSSRLQMLDYKPNPDLAKKLLKMKLDHGSWS